MSGSQAAAPVSWFGWFASVVVVYHIVIVGSFAAKAGFFVPDQVHGAISLAAALTAVFLMIPAAGKAHDAAGDPQARRRRPTIFDLALLLSAWISLGYVVFFHDEILDYSLYGFLDAKGVVLALLICVPLIEAVRRTTGPTLPILVFVLV